MHRIRTISQTVAELHKLDENCAITEYCVRQLCKQKLPFVIKSGTKYLINLDAFIEYLDNGFKIA